MSTNKLFDRICVIVLIVMLVGTLLFMNGSALGIKAVADEDAEAYEGAEYFTANDRNGSWESSHTAYIEMDGDDGSISGGNGGAYFLNGDLVIAQAGYYEVTGSLENGSIIIDTADGAKVWLRLNGVEVNCEDDACIRINEADKVFLTLAENSENTLHSGSAFSEEALEDGTDGAIFAHDDLTINGSGALSITADYKYGIAANDELRITGGTIDITAAEDTIHVNEHCRITEASIILQAGDDAIHSESDIVIVSGTILINECYEGIEAPTIDILGGDITIYPRDDGINAGGGSDSFGNMNFGGGFGGFGGGPGNSETASEDIQNSSEESEEQAEKEQTEKSEGERPEMSGGEMPEMPNGGVTEKPGDSSEADTESTETAEETVTPTVTISGGSITIINKNGMDADGIDSNGNVYINGGNVFISLNGGGTNNAIDYGSENNGVFEINGGVVIAAGGATMLEEVSDTSSQVSFLYSTSGTTQASAVQVTDANGNELLSCEIPYAFQALLISTPELQLGDTVNLVIGDTNTEVALDKVVNSAGTGAGGMMEFGGMPFSSNAPVFPESDSGENDSETEEKQETEETDGTA
ncbi:MAG: carbohydrate-binding domain-containing protein [Eubacteriales bacterium]|nr:carbohydrate-binding domain-containing protein [Eubacteriales bacterium]